MADQGKGGCGCGGTAADDAGWTDEMEEVEAFYEDHIEGRGPSGGAEEEDDDAESGTGLVEDGHDLATHGGGSLESVPGFELIEPMVEGIGDTDPTSLPEGALHMPMAGALHFDSGPLETVCGRDDREIVSAGVPPWRMICQLIITMADGTRSRGTGWFISPRTVMTAGHCIHSSKNGGWATSVEVIPGMSGQVRPFGSAVSTEFHSVRGWVRRAEPGSDYGCIVLPPTERLGERTGWFGFAALKRAELKNLLANNSGYPGDKAFGTQWYNAGRITKIGPKRLHYMFDTAPGQSGSPTWRYRQRTGKRHVIGVHAYGGCANKATRITPEVFGQMKTWKDMGA